MSLLIQSIISAPIRFISEVKDDQVDTSAMKKEMLQHSNLRCYIFWFKYYLGQNVSSEAKGSICIFKTVTS